MKDPHLIIVRPLLTEKSTDQASMNKYHFRVATDANKIEIAEAVQQIYARDGVRVLAVNTMMVKGKKRRAMVRGSKPGYSPNWKKAIVTTDKPLVLFEGV
ncbi:MAG TPA: 50S ribosomal protein L23 [Chthonomonadaceae bacterium]|jgi:large subunit ribosomal protein L23|nr:50S ribosomal protein L23 [Chthonomonadaceae bacterium]